MQRLIDFSLDYDIKNPTQYVSNKKLETDVLLDCHIDDDRSPSIKRKRSENDVVASLAKKKS
jgi:hypothetical protein